LRAWQAGAQDALIAEASVSEGRLFLLSCALEHLDLLIRQVPALAHASDEDLRGFQLAEDGSYLHWPRLDVHLDLGAVRYLIDPVARRRMDLVRVAHDRRFGEAVASLRRDRGLEQWAIPGVSERQVRRIEAGSIPRVSTLEKLAAAHGKKVDEYLAEIAGRASGGLAQSPRRSGVQTVKALRRLHKRLAGLPPITDAFLRRAKDNGRL
jgi:transcriptional regulator with XRE-family HTH domain